MTGPDICEASEDRPGVTLSIPGTLAAAADVGAWVDAAAERIGIAPSLLFQIRLCSEELVVNAILHGRPPDPTDFRIHISILSPPPAFRLVVRDNGLPFDPTGFAAASSATNLAEAQVGGRGLQLVRHFSEAMNYQHLNGWNHYEMTFATA